MSDSEFAEESTKIAKSILRAAEIEGEVSLSPMFGGGNNRLFRVDCGRERYVLKRYFRHPLDPRNRFNAETRFSAFLWKAGLHNIPEPVAGDPLMSAALYGFVEGERLARSGIGAWHVEQALAFVDLANRDRRDEFAATLPAASESCFSIVDHLELLDSRIDRLKRASGVAAQFAEGSLCGAWAKVRAATLKRAGDGAENILYAHERCLSPSDFGFHNALMRADGSLAFLDFEYAGWDDPAKMACDFFCQVDYPVPFDLFDGFVARIAPWFGSAEATAARCRILLPVYRIKWSCIVLNALTPAGLARRKFAGLVEPGKDEIAERLDKAHTGIERAMELL